MNNSVIIPNQSHLDQTIAAMAAGGAGKLHILTDFDNTLTRAFVDDQKTHSIIANIRLGNYLGDEFSHWSKKRVEKYWPLETDLRLSRAERARYMREWWDETHAQMVKHGLSRQLLDKICEERPVAFRAGMEEFENRLKSSAVPVVIMSAAPGYMIKYYLEQAHLFANNVDIIANWYEFDANGIMTGAKEPVIHSLNKYEITLNGYPIFEQIKNRRNVILMGDGVDDIGMIEGFDYDNIIKIGFLNENADERLDDFKKNFDVVILNDDGMEAVNDILKIILS